MGQTLLWIDATMRKEEESRSFQMGQAYVDAFLQQRPEIQLNHRVLREDTSLVPMRYEEVLARETVPQEENSPLTRYAKEFAAVDFVVISAPYWDLTFPAVLKCYLEWVCCLGVTFRYGPQGPISLCAMQQLTYLTAGGGNVAAFDLGTEYLRGLGQLLFGNPRFSSCSAQRLDVEGTDVEQVMAEALEKTKALAKEAGALGKL